MSETNDRSSQENMYESRQGDRAPISVQADGAPVGENNDVADPDSDKQLGQFKQLIRSTKELTRSRER